MRPAGVLVKHFDDYPSRTVAEEGVRRYGVGVLGAPVPGGGSAPSCTRKV